MSLENTAYSDYESPVKGHVISIVNVIKISILLSFCHMSPHIGYVSRALHIGMPFMNILRSFRAREFVHTFVSR